MPERRRNRRAQTPRFRTLQTPEREVYLLLQHLAGTQIQGLAVVLRPYGITPEQYHVLRVLGDAGAAGLACSGIAERSVRGDPDVRRPTLRGSWTRSKPSKRRSSPTRANRSGSPARNSA